MNATGVLLLLGVSFGVTGCKQPTAEARFTHDFNCEPTSVEEVGGGRFRLQGCGYDVTYTCIREGAAFGSGSSGVSCIREAAVEEPRRYEPPPAPRRGSVSRTTDEASGARGVVAEIPLLQSGSPGPWLRFKSKPGEASGVVWVSVEGSSRQLADEACAAFSLVVNGVAASASVPTRANHGAVQTIRGSYVAATFAPLTQKNPTLGVNVCGATFTVPDDELDKLQKFLAIREELSLSSAAAVEP